MGSADVEMVQVENRPILAGVSGRFSFQALHFKPHSDRRRIGVSRDTPGSPPSPWKVVRQKIRRNRCVSLGYQMR
jgi:hypothetical protein